MFISTIVFSHQCCQSRWQITSRGCWSYWNSFWTRQSHQRHWCRRCGSFRWRRWCPRRSRWISRRGPWCGEVLALDDVGEVLSLAMEATNDTLRAQRAQRAPNPSLPLYLYPTFISFSFSLQKPLSLSLLSLFPLNVDQWHNTVLMVKMMRWPFEGSQTYPKLSTTQHYW